MILFYFQYNLENSVYESSDKPRQIELRCDLREVDEKKRNKPSVAWQQFFNMKSTIDPKSHQTCYGDSGGILFVDEFKYCVLIIFIHICSYYIGFWVTISSPPINSF